MMLPKCADTFKSIFDTWGIILIPTTGKKEDPLNFWKELLWDEEKNERNMSSDYNSIDNKSDAFFSILKNR